MIEGRELGMDDYVAMLRRRWKTIVIPTLFAPLAAFLISYAFPAKYTSQSLILVQGQKVPENMIQPIVSEDLAERVATLQQQVKSQSRLQPVVDRLFPAKNAEEKSEIIDQIRTNMAVEPIITDLSQIGTTAAAIKGKRPSTGQMPGFNVNYTASNPREAQQICNEVTSLLVQENEREVQDAATGTSEVLNRSIEDGKRHLDDLDSKLASFKKKYVGQLPEDEENNLKILMGLNSQLEANTQTLNRAQQDKAFTESMLAQQVATWKSSQTANNPETLQKQLSDLQSQLLQLQARYTNDHPDVIKTKADITEVKRKLAELNKASENPGDDAANEKAYGMEPPEIRQMRLQIHQYSDLITAATRDQKRLQQEIGNYQSRVSLSPAVEEEYKGLTRDYDNARKNYDDLLSKKSTADLTVKMTNQAQGERMFPLNPANLPDSPSFPNRLYFAGAGLGAGLAIGLALALLIELTDKSIRTEADAEAALQLPMLVAVPWLGATSTNGNGNGNGNGSRFWSRNKHGGEERVSA